MTKFKTTPYTVNVYDLMHRPGRMREATLSVRAEAKLGEGLIALEAGTLLEIELRMESVHEGILVSGEAESAASGVCGRCLTEIEQRVQVDFQELFAYSSDEAFDYQVHGDHVDCEPLIRDAVVLALPFQPVCRPDCVGLDPETGERMVGQPDREPEERVDPRWSALAGFQASEDTSTGITEETEES